MKKMHFMGWIQNRGILTPRSILPPPPCYKSSYVYGRVFVSKFAFMLYVIFPVKIKKGNSSHHQKHENYKS
jgi:hypothetical protein